MLNWAVDRKIILKWLLQIWFTMMWINRTYPSLGFCGDRKEYLEQLNVHWLNRSFWITKLVYESSTHLHMKWTLYAPFYETEILIIAFLWFIWLGMTWRWGNYLNVNIHQAIRRTASREENHCYRILVMMLSNALHYHKRQNGSDYSVLSTWHI